MSTLLITSKTLFSVRTPTYTNTYTFLTKQIEIMQSNSPTLCLSERTVARHTWASLANGAGINIHHISKALGHSSIKTTEIYLAELPTDVLFNDSRRVAERIKKVLKTTAQTSIRESSDKV